jgi:hypothetical protein
MSDEQLHISPRVGRIITSEEAIYGLILVSGMIVATASAGGTSLDAFITVVVTVIIFFAAHVYAGTLGRLAATNGESGVRASLAATARHSSGMLIASVPALIILLLGATRAIDDSAAMWSALIADAVVLGALGWMAVARWSTHWLPRILSALTTAAFGGVLVLLKAIIHH